MVANRVDHFLEAKWVVVGIYFTRDVWEITGVRHWGEAVAIYEEPAIESYIFEIGRETREHVVVQK